jgi:hypothetical protein
VKSVSADHRWQKCRFFQFFHWHRPSLYVISSLCDTHIVQSLFYLSLFVLRVWIPLPFYLEWLSHSFEGRKKRESIGEELNRSKNNKVCN